MAMGIICPTVSQVHGGRHPKLPRSRVILTGSFMFALTIYFVMALASYHVSFVPCRYAVQQQVAQRDYNIQKQLQVRTAFEDGDKCAGRFIYVYDLPPQFNIELVEHCNETNAWPHMCEDLSNGGFGQLIMATNKSGRLSGNSILLPRDVRHITSQFSLEVLFHERLKRYACLTNDPNIAVFAYIPFYTALDLTKTLFLGTAVVKDRLSQRLMGWLENNPHWRASHGHGHVLVLGRIVWDYMRKEEDGWGSALLSFPGLKNVTKLSIERDPHALDQMAIPYPTSWHPYTDEHIRVWQEMIRSVKRETLVLYAGMSRGNNMLREELLKQCNRQPDANCTLVPCGGGGADAINCAREQDVLLEKFLTAVFCLQPPGDSETRKGVFDCLIAGSIPVFFDTWTSHSQYEWHLPSNRTSYSVILPRDETAQGKLDVVNELAQIPHERIAQMQKAIRELLPNIIYKKPGSSMRSRDAFDLAIDNLLERFRPAATG